MKKITQQQWFIIATIFAFASIISFFNISSAWADENDFNGLAGFLGIGILSGILAGFSLYKSK
jgi:hypothetical protein